MVAMYAIIKWDAKPCHPVMNLYLERTAVFGPKKNKPRMGRTHFAKFIPATLDQCPWLRCMQQ